MGAVSCEPCPAGTTSAGGQVSSCSCTDGTFEYVDLRPNPAPGTYWERNGVKYTCRNKYMVYYKASGAGDSTNPNVLFSVKNPGCYDTSKVGATGGVTDADIAVVEAGQCPTSDTPPTGCNNGSSVPCTVAIHNAHDSIVNPGTTAHPGVQAAHIDCLAQYGFDTENICVVKPDN